MRRTALRLLYGRNAVFRILLCRAGALIGHTVRCKAGHALLARRLASVDRNRFVPVASPTMSASLGGRRAEAARNDVRVLSAAREVLTLEPDAPMSDIARRAGVGVGTLVPALRQPRGARRRTSAWMACAGWRPRRARARARRRRPLGRVRRLHDGRVRRRRRLAGRVGHGDVHADARSSSRRAATPPAALRELLARAQGGRRGARGRHDRGRRPAVRAAARGPPRRRARGRPSCSGAILRSSMQALRAPAAGPLPGPPPGWDEIRRRWTARVDARRSPGHPRARGELGRLARRRSTGTASAPSGTRTAG